MNEYPSLQLEGSRDALGFIVERGLRQAVSRVGGQRKGSHRSLTSRSQGSVIPYILHPTRLHPNTSEGLPRALYTPFCLLCQELCPKTKQSDPGESPGDARLLGISSAPGDFQIASAFPMFHKAQSPGPVLLTVFPSFPCSASISGRLGATKQHIH